MHKRSSGGRVDYASPPYLIAPVSELIRVVASTKGSLRVRSESKVGCLSHTRGPQGRYTRYRNERKELVDFRFDSKTAGDEEVWRVIDVASVVYVGADGGGKQRTSRR